MGALAHLGSHGAELAADPWGHWNADPLAAGALTLTLFVYGQAALRLPPAARRAAFSPDRIAAFALGWLALAAALISPVDPAGGVLLSAHMAQHVLLIAVAAPLLCYGMPLARLGGALPPRLRRLSQALGRRRGAAASAAIVLSAVAAHALLTWAWHLPGPYEAALRSDALHALEHYTFLVSALLAWWAILAFGARTRPDAVAIAALLLLALQGAALGALMTFSSGLWYPVYEHGAAADPLADQQLAGLLMWGVGGLAPVIAGACLVAVWLDRFERRASGSGAPVGR